MATQALTIREDEINALYESASTGDLHNRIINLESALDTLTSTVDDFTERTAIAKNKVDAVVEMVDGFVDTKQEDLDELNLKWGNKRAIMTTASKTGGKTQPNFIGDYSELTNADFEKGSVCFILNG